jgi:hypothetical protein
VGVSRKIVLGLLISKLKAAVLRHFELLVPRILHFYVTHDLLGAVCLNKCLNLAEA